MRKPVLATLAASLLALAPAAPAQAIQFANSSTTGKSVVLIPFRTGGSLVGPVGYSFGLRAVPSVSDLLGPAGLGAGFIEGPSYMADVDFALRYRHQLADINFLGRFNPAISPFLGYRALGALTTSAGGTSLANAGVQGGLNYLHGPQLGIAADTELPLGLSGYAHGGMTILTGGAWDSRRNGLEVTGSGAIDPKGAMLPLFGFGAAWQVGPVFRIAAGWDIFALPTHMRKQQATLDPGTTWVNGFSLGITLLGLSI